MKGRREDLKERVSELEVVHLAARKRKRMRIERVSALTRVASSV